MNSLQNLIRKITRTYQCPVIVSEVLARKDKLSWKVKEANTLLRSLGVVIIPHSDISEHHIHDNVHLDKFVDETDQYSGTQRFARNLYQAFYGRKPLDTRLPSSIKRHTKRPAGSYVH